MRSLIFNILFGVITVIFTLLCALFCLWPSRAPLMWALRRYATRMVQLMRLIGINIRVSGHENIPDGPAIIAAKHQSYGDGFVLMSQIKDLSFVTGDHITKFPFIRQILTKMNAVIVSNCGSPDVRATMNETTRIIRDQGRKMLIFPEGHLSPAGTHHAYKRGVYHLYKDLGCPVVPVAQNLGQRWNQQDWAKFPGPAKMEFLPPIEPGLGKDEFMARLQERIETRSIELLDRKNQGALKLENIGQLTENESAKRARLKKQSQTQTNASIT